MKYLPKAVQGQAVSVHRSEVSHLGVVAVLQLGDDAAVIVRVVLLISLRVGELDPIALVGSGSHFSMGWTRIRFSM